MSLDREGGSELDQLRTCRTALRDRSDSPPGQVGQPPPPAVWVSQRPTGSPPSHRSNGFLWSFLALVDFG